VSAPGWGSRGSCPGSPEICVAEISGLSVPNRTNDNFVTRFYEPVTGWREGLTTRLARSGTKDMGEAMAPAPRDSTSGGLALGAGAAPVLLLAVALGCGDPPPPARAVPDAGPAAVVAAPPALPEPATATGYWAAFFDDVVAGDRDAARAGYEAALARADVDPQLAARAALRLADLEGAAGNRRRALELVARAAALGTDDDAVQDAAERQRARLMAAPSGAADVRGPAVGTPLPGVAPAVAAAFAAAEAQLAQVHRMRMVPVLEALSSTVRAKQRATEEAVRAYRAVAEAGGIARVAAQYRIGSLYHDLALELVFDLPPELDPGVASRLRRSLRTSALGYLKKATAAYRASKDEPAADAQAWRAAADADLRGAEALLGER